MTGSGQMPPAGWYDDPGGSGGERYWDGTAWTNALRQREAPTAPPSPQIAPPTPPSPVSQPGGGWNWGWLLFSFEGRAHRGHYWAVYAVVFVAGTAMAGAVGAFLDDSSTDDNAVFAIGSFVVVAVLLWTYLAIAVKRAHDRGRAGSWLWVLLIPIVGAIWVFVELGFLEGDLEANQYGPRPL